MSWNVKYALLMLISTVITYGSGLLMQQSFSKNAPKKNLRKFFLILSLTSNLGILIFFKYFNFINSSITSFFESIHVQWGFDNLDILLPVGISFYTFQALSYSFDVYYGKTKPTAHFGKYALYVSFFPQLVAGPIERSWHLLPQFNKRIRFNYNRIRDGLALVVRGIFAKVVIADRLAVVVNTVYSQPENYAGIELIIAAIFFSFQIYADFSAYTDIARGSARILGFNLMENFNKPYFATSIPDFWRRWHMSLTTWFRDYLYIPLGGNRVSLPRWYVNIMIVFIISGLWHGAAWNFIIWGFLHGIFQLIDLYTRNVRKRLNTFFNIDTKAFDIKILKRIWTFVLVSFAWIFFRAETFDKAMTIIERATIVNPWKLFDGSLYNLGLDAADFKLSLFLILLILLFWSLRNISPIRRLIFKQHVVIRYTTYLATILAILIFGYYGSRYDASQFIYFQF